MTLDLEQELPGWLLELIAPFALRPIDFYNPIVRARAIQHMDSVFGLHDPFLDWIIRKGPDNIRTRARKLLYEMDIDGFIACYGTAWENGDGLAAAWWTPPSASKLSLWETLQLVPTGMQIVGWTRVIECFSVLGKVEKVRPNEPHWYLNNLAVAEFKQKQRFGTALLVPILWLADRDKVPVFLMIANPDNRHFYERLGFHLVREALQPQFGKGVPFYKAMLRRPEAIEMTPGNIRRLLEQTR